MVSGLTMCVDSQCFLIALLLIYFKFEGFQVRSWSRGLISFLMENALLYVIETRNRTTMILFSRNILSHRTWLVRYDVSDNNVDFPHMKINHQVTEVDNPHTRVSKLQFHVVKVLGRLLESLNEIAFPLAIAFILYDVDLILVIRSQTPIVFILGEIVWNYGFGFFFSCLGDVTLRSWWPGIGRMIGALIGGIYGGMLAEKLEAYK